MGGTASLTVDGKLPELGVRPSIGVICFRYMGDLVLVSALLHNLRRQWPEARLTLVCDDRFTSVARAMRVEGKPLLDEVLVFPRSDEGGPARVRSWGRLVAGLRRQKFDLLLDAVGTSTSQALCRIAGAKLSVGYLKPGKKPGPYGRFARYFDKKTGYDPHFLEHYLQLLQPIAVPVREPVPRLEASPEVERAVWERLAALGLRSGEFVVIHFGARLERRVWRLEKVARLALGLVKDGVPVLLLYGPGEEKLAGELKTVLANIAAIPPFWDGPADFETLLAIAAASQVFVGNDSGPMHVAAAAGARVVGLFGKTEPARWGPRGTGTSTTVQAPMPCECAFKEICQPERGETSCVWKVEVDPVRAAVDRLRGDLTPGVAS